MERHDKPSFPLLSVHCGWIQTRPLNAREQVSTADNQTDQKYIQIMFFFFLRENKQKEEEINPHLTLSVCFSSFLSLSVREPSFPVQGLLYTGKAWRSVNNTQPEAPLQPSNVTLHTAERRRRHRTDGNNAGVSLPACSPPCLSVCLTQSGSGFLRQ